MRRAVAGSDAGHRGASLDWPPVKPANRLPWQPLLAALLLGLLIHTSTAARSSAPDAAALRGAELGLLASHMDPAAPVDAPPPEAAASAPAAAPAPTPQGEPHVIFVDAGHGGSEIGAAHADASGREDLIEKDVNLAIALRLAAMLRTAGYSVAMTRTSDTRPVPDGPLAADLQARADLANQAGADLFISIHHNGSNDPTMRGTEVYYCAERPFSADNRRLASLLEEALVRNLRQAGYDTIERGVKDDAVIGHIAVLAQNNLARPTTMPGVLGEALFLSNDHDAAALARPEVQEAIARGYCEAIQAYFTQP